MTDVADVSQWETVRVGVRIKAWGAESAQLEFAVYLAQERPAARWWHIASIERLDGVSCPLDLEDPGSIAADCGPGWAYVVYPAGRGRS